MAQDIVNDLRILVMFGIGNRICALFSSKVFEMSSSAGMFHFQHEVFRHHLALSNFRTSPFSASFFRFPEHFSRQSQLEIVRDVPELTKFFEQQEGHIQDVLLCL
jgi:hypothetical protein